MCAAGKQCHQHPKLQPSPPQITREAISCRDSACWRSTDMKGTRARGGLGGAEDTALPLSHSSHPSSAPTEPHSSQHYPSYEVQKKITWKELLLWRTIHAHFQPVNSFLFCRATVGSQRRAGLSQVSITAVVLPTSKPLF